MIVPIFQIDAFAERLFEGNPASVCILQQGWLPDVIMQRIATENNHSETAFIVPDGGAFWRIKWFTPTCEVKLCGHATLAAAHVIFEYASKGTESIVFDSLSGRLAAQNRSGGLIELDFPAKYCETLENPPDLEPVLGLKPLEVLACEEGLVALFDSESSIRRLSPDSKAIEALEAIQWVAVTAPGTDCDFVSRFFAPKLGIKEDPATGFMHTFLTNLWAERMDKDLLEAKQLSGRGAHFICELKNHRIALAGRCIRYSEGFIEF